MPPSRKVLIIGHRGCAGLAPENTLASLLLAVRQGADMVEFDVQASAGGEPVVIHDATLDRTTDGRGPVAATPLARILRLDAGSWHSPAFAGEPVPTLESVLAAPGLDLPLIAEIKTEAAASPAWETAAGRIAALLRTRAAGRGIAVSSFSPEVLAEFRARTPEIPRGLLLAAGATPDEAGELIRDIDPSSLHVPADLLGPGFLSLCAEFHLPLYVYTENDPLAARRLADRGAAGIFTDRPDLLAREFRRA